jgi:O-antigen/teichoic acid export membrane protein
MAGDKNILRHAVNYFGANMATQALGLISLPILTRLLTQEDFGSINLYLSLLGFSVVIFSLNLHAAVSRFYFEAREEQLGLFINTALISVAVLYAFCCVFSLIFRESIAAYLNISLDIFYTIIAVTPFLILQNTYDSINTAANKSRAVMWNTLILSYGKFLFTVLFIFLFFKTYKSRLLADIVTLSAMSIWYVAFIYKKVSRGYSTEYLRYIISYALPLVPHSLSYILLHSFGQVLINKYCGQKEVGLYSFAYTIGMLSFIVYQSIHTAAMPEFYRMMNEGKFDGVRKQSDYLSKMALLFSCGVAFFGPDIGRVLGPTKYHSSLTLIPVIVAGYVVMSFYQTYGRLIFFSKKTYFVSFTTLSAGLLNVILNVITIPVYGYQAAAFTTLISFFYTLISGWIICTYVLKSPAASPFSSKLKMLAIFFPVFFMAIIFENYLSMNKWLILLIKLPLMLFIIRLFFFNETLQLLKVFPAKK